MKQQIRARQLIDDIQISNLFCSFYGNTFLSIFFKDAQVLKLVFEKLSDEAETSSSQSLLSRKIYALIACHDMKNKTPKIIQQI